jgi:hypothetical protein
MIEYRRKYCMDKDFLGSVERVKKTAKSEYPPFMDGIAD